MTAVGSDQLKPLFYVDPKVEKTKEKARLKAAAAAAAPEAEAAVAEGEKAAV